MPAAASRLEPQGDLFGGVLLVVPEVGDLEELCAEELRGPVALLARLPGGTQVFDGGGDRSRVRVQHHGQDLPRPGDLRFHVP